MNHNASFNKATTKHLGKISFNDLEIKEISKDHLRASFFVYVQELLHTRNIHRHKCAHNFASPSLVHQFTISVI